MPRNVRNFWIEAEVDGRKTPIAFGPRSKDGGFTLRVYMRDKGIVTMPLQITGVVSPDGEDLTLWVSREGRRQRTHVTER